MLVLVCFFNDGVKIVPRYLNLSQCSFSLIKISAVSVAVAIFPGGGKNIASVFMCYCTYTVWQIVSCVCFLVIKKCILSLEFPTTVKSKNVTVFVNFDDSPKLKLENTQDTCHAHKEH